MPSMILYKEKNAPHESEAPSNRAAVQLKIARRALHVWCCPTYMMQDAFLGQIALFSSP